MNSRRKISRVSGFLSPIQLGFYSSSVPNSPTVKTSSRQISPPQLKSPAYRERKFQNETAFGQPRVAFALVLYSKNFRCTNMALAKRFTSASNLEITELGFGDGKNKKNKKVDGYQTMNSGLDGDKFDDSLRSDRSLENDASMINRFFMINPKNPNHYPDTSTSIYDATMAMRSIEMEPRNHNSKSKPNPNSTSTANISELGLEKMDEDKLVSSSLAGSENSKLGGNLIPDWTPAANNATVNPKKTLTPNPKFGPIPAVKLGFGKMDEDQFMCSGLNNNKLASSLNCDPTTANSVSVIKRVIKTSPHCNRKPNTNPSSAVNDSSRILRLFKNTLHNPNTNLEELLNEQGLVVSEDLVLQIFSRMKNNWNSAMFFFSWANKQPGYRHGTEAYNAMLNILGKHKCFLTMWKLVFEMHKHNPSLVTDETFSIVIRRYATAHMVERAIEAFYRRMEFGLKLNTPAFQVLLDALCKARHVQEAEALFNLKQKEYKPDMKSRNIILNGWCGFPNLREAKRFWNEMNKKGCKPNLITYSTYINALAKKSKLNTALTLFGQMWDAGCTPDVSLCNAILDALCLKKGIPAALDVFDEMNERGCLPDAVTYNTLIKHICDSGSVDKAYELLDEMQKRGCAANVRTYHYFFRAAVTPEKALKVFQRMLKTGCMPTSDTYNLMLKMLLGWNEMDKVLMVWDDMEKSGMGPDQRSYTVMVHCLHEKGKFNDAYRYYNEMRAKGLSPEPKTTLLANAMEVNAKIGGMRCKNYFSKECLQKTN